MSIQLFFFQVQARFYIFLQPQVIQLLQNIQNSMIQNSNSRTRPKTSLYKDILSIKDLQVSLDDEVQVYPRAYAIPQFFTQNLVDQNRIIKIFNSENAVIEAFAFQYMKLALQIEADNQNDYLEIVKDIFVREKDGLIGEQGQLSDQLLTDFQYKKFFKDFIEIVESQNYPDFQQTAKKYPIIKKIIRKLFMKLVPFTLFLKDQQNDVFSDFDIVGEIFQYLSNIFEIQLNLEGQCYKFQESDMFVYVQSLNEIYVAYMKEREQQQQNLFIKSTNSSFVCGEGNSFTSKFKRTKNNHETAQNSFKRRNVIKQQESESLQQSDNMIKEQPNFDNMIQSKVSQSLPSNFQNYDEILNMTNFSIKRRSKDSSNSGTDSNNSSIKQRGNSNSQNKSSQQNKSNTIINILDSRAFQPKFVSVQSIENIVNGNGSSFDYLTESLNLQKNKSSNFKSKYKVQEEIVQMRQEQEITQNTINSFNKLNQSPYFLKSFTKSQGKKLTSNQTRISLNERFVNELILKQSQNQWIKIHQKQNLSQYIRPQLKLNLNAQKDLAITSITLPISSSFNAYKQKFFSNSPKNYQIQKYMNVQSKDIQDQPLKFTKVISQASQNQNQNQKEIDLKNIQLPSLEIIQSTQISQKILAQEYNQFTESRILDLLEPQYRLKIKQIKNKFKQQSKIDKNNKNKSNKKISFITVSGSRSKQRD